MDVMDVIWASKWMIPAAGSPRVLTMYPDELVHLHNCPNITPWEHLTIMAMLELGAFLADSAALPS